MMSHVQGLGMQLYFGVGQNQSSLVKGLVMQLGSGARQQQQAPPLQQQQGLRSPV